MACRRELREFAGVHAPVFQPTFTALGKRCHMVFRWIANGALWLLIAGCETPAGGANIRWEIEDRSQNVETPSSSHPRPSIPLTFSELPAGEVLTVEAARSIAMSDNPDIHAARARLENALARVAEAKARYAPRFFFSHQSARIFQTPELVGRLGGLIQPTGGEGGFVPAGISGLLDALGRASSLDELAGNTNSYSEHLTGLSVGWVVFDGFVRDAAYRAAKYMEGAANASLDDVRRLLGKAVNNAYYQTQWAGERLRIAEADEAFSRGQWVSTEKLRDAGRATVADVENFRIRVLAAQAAVNAATGLRETGRVVLAELMGISEGKLPEHADLSPLANESADELKLPDAETWVAQALQQRPDLQQLDQFLQSEEENVRGARGLYWPMIGVGAAWGFDRGSNLRYESDDQTSGGGVEFRWELYSGGSRRAKVWQAESSRAETAARLSRQRLAVVSEVRKAVIELALAQDQIRLHRETVAVAKEHRRLIQESYQAGKEPLTRLNEAQRDFINAEAALTQARIRLRQAWSDLYAAAGHCW